LEDIKNEQAGGGADSREFTGEDYAGRVGGLA
jgi:hypothetical protein